MSPSSLTFMSLTVTVSMIHTSQYFIANQTCLSLINSTTLPKVSLCSHMNIVYPCVTYDDHNLIGIHTKFKPL